ncbi:methyltransferase [Micropruina sp.]|uniref:DUF7059 domain-containing protein n=1 Tax=Micropruina sp. TaxID=2737536 RepID=UPI0039E4F178
MLDLANARALARRLDDAGYRFDPVAERLGPAGLDGLARNATIPGDRALAGADDPQATVIRVFALQQSVPRPALEAALGDLEPLHPLLEAGADPGTVRAAIEIRPYAFSDDTGEHDAWLASDRTPNLDGRLGEVRDDFVLGLSPASVTLAQLTMPGRVGRALDLGCGGGVQSVHLSTHADAVVATDLNPRACAMTRFSAALSGIDVDVRQGSLYQPVAGDSFDLIVSNPPYVMSPPTASRLVYREGTFSADTLVRAVVTGAPARLNPGGALQVLGNWAIAADQPWQERLAEWIAPTGCDALVLQREQLDPYEYIELWLADAALTGTPEYRRRYAEWVDYFDSLGIVGVGLGWLTLYRNDAADPVLRFDDWPHRTHSGVGAAFAEFPQAARTARAPRHDLLAATFTVTPDLTQETIGRPGAADPEHVVLRRAAGFGRAAEVDTALAAVVGACDGELPLGVLIDAVADLLEVDAAGLTADLLPRLRSLISDGYVTAAGPL